MFHSCFLGFFLNWKLIDCINKETTNRLVTHTEQKNRNRFCGYSVFARPFPYIELSHTKDHTSNPWKKCPSCGFNGMIPTDFYYRSFSMISHLLYSVHTLGHLQTDRCILVNTMSPCFTNSGSIKISLRSSCIFSMHYICSQIIPVNVIWRVSAKTQVLQSLVLRIHITILDF